MANLLKGNAFSPSEGEENYSYEATFFTSKNHGIIKSKTIRLGFRNWGEIYSIE